MTLNIDRMQVLLISVCSCSGMQLLLLKRGGQVIYAGELGRHSHKLVEYFEVLLFSHILICNLNDAIT